MENIFLYTILVTTIVGFFTAILLFWVAKQFHVDEDPRIDQVNHALPGANCGGCGFPGCRNFAQNCVNAKSLEKLYCPVGGNETMAKVAKILGFEATEKVPTIAVLRCSGSPDLRPKHSHYDGPMSCAVAHTLFRGETGCQYGCMWFGDCVKACKYSAMKIDEATRLPVIIEENCIACGACAKACPRQLIEMRHKGPKGRRVFVSCRNEDKGNVASKHCKVACIGCGRCVKECPFEAITMINHLAYIDFTKCKLCRKCVAVCPTKAIHEVNFPPRQAAAAGEKV